MKRILLNIVALALCATMVQAADPTATNYTMRECEGSYMPYPDVKSVEACPDSLEPVMINHIGRHGARFPSSEKNIKAVLKSDAKVKASIKELKDLGFTVKYRFYRSTKKAASYKAAVTKKTAAYTNTSGKKGTKYFYKVQVRVYDENGKLIAKTALKQCKYAARVWTK